MNKETTASQAPSNQRSPVIGGIDDVLPCNDPSCHDRSESWFTWFRRREPTAPPPPDRTEIGRAAWMVIHSAAAQYPTNPSIQQKIEMKTWLQSFANLYPCHICRLGFVKIMQDLPPDTEGRDDLTLWACNAHNRVNNDIGLAQHPCDLARLLAMFGNEVNQEQK